MRMRFDTVVNNTNIILLFSLLLFRFDIHLHISRCLSILPLSSFCYEFSLSLYFSFGKSSTHTFQLHPFVGQEKFILAWLMLMFIWKYENSFVLSTCSVLGYLQFIKSWEKRNKKHKHTHPQTRTRTLKAKLLSNWIEFHEGLDIKKSFFM